MKTLLKYSLVAVLVLITAILLVNGSAGAVVLAPEDSDTVVRPVLGSGVAPIVVVPPRPALVRPPILANPFFPFFNPFFVNPFVDEEAFFGFEEQPFFGAGVEAD